MNDRFMCRIWDKKLNERILPMGILDSNEDDLVFEQCTGLKDKNGKLIYEGDVIRKGNHRFVIKYDFDGFTACDKEKRQISIYGLFTFKICSCGFPEKETENTIEVIGNIHENKDLLEQED